MRRLAFRRSRSSIPHRSPGDRAPGAWRFAILPAQRSCSSYRRASLPRASRPPRSACNFLSPRRPRAPKRRCGQNPHRISGPVKFRSARSPMWICRRRVSRRRTLIRFRPLPKKLPPKPLQRRKRKCGSPAMPRSLEPSEIAARAGNVGGRSRWLKRSLASRRPHERSRAKQKVQEHAQRRTACPGRSHRRCISH